jgi:hypothetical protein
VNNLNSKLIFRFALFAIKYPINQLPVRESIQNFGELKGSCKEGLKYKVMRQPEMRINQIGVFSDIFFTFLFAIGLSY